MGFQDRPLLRLGRRQIAFGVLALAFFMLTSAGAAQAKRMSGTARADRSVGTAKADVIGGSAGGHRPSGSRAVGTVPRRATPGTSPISRATAPNSEFAELSRVNGRGQAPQRRPLRSETAPIVAARPAQALPLYQLRLRAPTLSGVACDAVDGIGGVLHSSRRTESSA